MPYIIWQTILIAAFNQKGKFCSIGLSNQGHEFWLLAHWWTICYTSTLQESTWTSICNCKWTKDTDNTSSTFLFWIAYNYKRYPLMTCSSLMISPVDILLDGISSVQDSPSLSRAIRQSVFLLCEKSSISWRSFLRLKDRRMSITSIVLLCRDNSTYSRRLNPCSKVLSVGLLPVTTSKIRTP